MEMDKSKGQSAEGGKIKESGGVTEQRQKGK